MIEVIAVLALASVCAFLIHRFPDSGPGLGEELDNALYAASVRGVWLAAALAIIALVGVWLLL